MRQRSFIRAALLLGVATVLVVSGCSSSAPTEPEDVPALSDAEIDEALESETTLEVWSSDATFPAVADAFMEKYPSITVNITNLGSGEQLQKFQQAVQAGSGVPDVVWLEYVTMPSVAATGALADLTGTAIEDLAGDFDAGVWSRMFYSGDLYGVPVVGGPMAFFYNEAVYDQYGLTLPATWDGLIEEGKKLKAQNPDLYVLERGWGHPALIEGMLWLIGAKPYDVEGENITIDLTGADAQRVAEFWDTALEHDLVAPGTSGDDVWNGYTQGQTVSSMAGGWMNVQIPAIAPDQSGQWRVATLPVFDEGDAPGSGMIGGGGYSIAEQSENKAVAAGLLRFFASPEADEVYLETQQPPTTTSLLNSTEWLDIEYEYFGGQQVNQVLAESMQAINTEWEWLPFQAYAYTIFPDTVGKAFKEKTSILDGLAAWQAELEAYAKTQGFTVN